MDKLISAAEAAELIKDGASVAVGGFGAYGAPETLLQAVADSFERTGRPRGLAVMCAVSPGDNTQNNVGLNRIAKIGLMDSVTAGHFANSPLTSELIAQNAAAGYAIPLGVMLHLFDAAAGKKPAVLTHVGLGTCADPRQEGCRANRRAAEDGRKVVELVKMDGREYLAYKTFPVDVCLIRAECADENGNLSAEDGAVGDLTFDMAAAAHNSGGVVIAEVKRIVAPGSLHPKRVCVHGSLVDHVVVSEAGMYAQGYAAQYRPELCGASRVPAAELEAMALTNRKLIARRGAMELRPGQIINLGIGIPSGIGSVANEEGIPVSMSLESGPQGGVPVEGLGFGASANPDAIYRLSDVFHLYDGGFLDMTFLGAAEIDARGNVNVSKFNSRCTGPGGFINISQNTKRVHFMGTFTTDGLKEEIRDGKLLILQEGKTKKFRSSVQQITFSGEYARSGGQRVMYITERAVFVLTGEGLMLTEIAPGVELGRDILGQMEFEPLISKELREMDARIFRPEIMGIGTVK